MNTSEHTIRARAIDAALGKVPFDVLLTGGTVIDVATSELRQADVGIVGNLIASVHPPGMHGKASGRHDLSGQFLVPGFIDMHVHFESSHMTPVNYASVVVPQGTTTIFYDPHELGNVLGVGGVRYAIESSRGLLLRFICAAPSCVPSAPGLETAGSEIGGREMRQMLSWPEVAGVGEMMDMSGTLAHSPRTSEILAAGLDFGKLIEGHARGMTGSRLQAFMAAGVSSDHEVTSADDFLEKVRAGLTIELRGSHDYVLPDVVKAIRRLSQVPSTVCICTDDVPPDHLIEKGGICDVVRRLISYGLDPVQAIRCATLNASYRLRRSDIGLIAAGRIADIVVLRNLPEVEVASTFVGGRLVATDGKLLAQQAESKVAEPPYSERLPLPTLKSDDFQVEVPGVSSGRVRLRVIKGVRFTEWSEVDVEVRDGYAELPPQHAFMFVQHRHGKHDARPQRTFLADWGELKGAVATTYSHDSHNLVVLGGNTIDMMVAANALIDCGGGMTVAKDGRILAILKMPIAGLLSPARPQQVAQSLREVREAAGHVIEWKPPYRVFKAIEGTCLACNPGPHLTDLGLTDGTTSEIVSGIAGRS